MNENSKGSAESVGAELTYFACGPSKCPHDYSGWREYVDDSGCRVGTAVCAKCGAEAFSEAAWD